MHHRDESIPLSPALTPIKGREHLRVAGGVDRRVLLLAIQAIVNAAIIGVIAKVLIYLIDFITNLAFYGRLSFMPASPAHHHLGLFVIAVPIIGSLLVGLMA